MLCYVELLWVKLIIVNSYQMTAFSLVHVHVFFALRNDKTFVDKHHIFMAVLIHYYHGNIMHQFIFTKNKWNACKNIFARFFSKFFIGGGSAGLGISNSN